MRKTENNLETTSRMVDLTPIISMNTLKINGLNASIERQRVSGCRKGEREYLTICCVKET